jgi:hypothetical protein
MQYIEPLILTNRETYIQREREREREIIDIYLYREVGESEERVSHTCMHVIPK